MQYVKPYSNTDSIIRVKINVNNWLLKATDSLRAIPGVPSRFCSVCIFVTNLNCFVQHM
jgi:hypothetical protein